LRRDHSQSTYTVSRRTTTGIDVASARQIRHLIAGLNRAGTTIFLTTHYIEESERLCHRIAFILAGKSCGSTPWQTSSAIQEKHVMQLAVSNSEPALLDKLATAFLILDSMPLPKG